MNSINANINNKYILRTPFKSGGNNASEQKKQTEEVQIPDLYYVPDSSYEQKSFKETVKEADMMGMVYPWIAHPFMMVGTCAGLAYGVDKFSQACGGEYGKSLLGKAANFGDRIQNSQIAQSDFVKKIFDAGKRGKKEFNSLTKNSDVINAIRTTPSMPEWGFVKDELLSQEQRVVHEFIRITDELGLAGESTSGGFLGMFGMGGSGGKNISLNHLALTKEEKEFIKNITNEEEAVNTVLLKRLGRSESEIKSIIDLKEGATPAVKEEILKEMGLTVEDLERIKRDTTGQYIKEVKAAAEKVKNKVWIGAGNYSWMGPVQPFERRIGCDEVYNRLHSMTDEASTATGKFMSRFLQRCHRGFTFGGGKLGVLMFVAPHLVETMIDAKKADPDAKVGTVANGVISAMSWVFTFPLGLKIMHSLTGAQYAGMSKEQVQEYRDLINDFNKRVKSDEFKSKSEYDVAKKELKTKLKALKTPAKPQNLLTKACRKLGSFITMDLEQIKSYRNGSFAGNTARKLPSFFKNLGGIPIRLILWGAITMFGLDALITKGTKAIFGNFYDRTKEEEHEANKKKQKRFLKEDLQARMLEAQRKKIEGTSVNNENEQQEIVQTLNADKIQTKEKTISETADKNNETSQEQITDEQNEIQENNSEVSSSDIVQESENSNTMQEQITEEKPVAESSVSEPTIAQEQENIATDEVIKEEQQPNNRYIPNPNPNPELFKEQQKPKNQDTYTYIPSQDSVLKQNPEKQQTKYIPSQTAPNIVKNFDNSGLESALRRADRAEAKALRVLSGQFD